MSVTDGKHQLCYYPQYEDRSLPEDLQHYCVDCQPRAHDRGSARARQQVKREEQASIVNGMKRQAPKSHKKKVKEPGYTNGWPLDKSRHDRNSASPRDQPPPAKRPKTSHRPSDSVASASAKGHSRKRTVTNASTRRSLSRSPETPLHLYSEEFMRCYLEDDWSITNVNLHNSIDLSNALSEWLSAPEDEFHSTHGHAKTEVLMRWDGELDDIPGKAQIDIHEVHDNRLTDSNGHWPMWKIVSVKEPVANGAYIGELKGHVGFKEEYQQDPANRWSLLRHPEPFVFFHPRLPIHIDARNEGTQLRYVRRSCMPNARLQVLVTDSTDYRFCFMATQQIDPGMEVAVAWDTSDAIPELMRHNQNCMSERDMDQLSSWVSTVLANCGPCACQLPASECKMSRFDRRGLLPEYGDEAQSAKAPKAKKKKSALHISPLNTQVNSRSGSEARKVDPDDEPSESRSASGSNGRGSASRDITPKTHYSHNGSLSAIPELSERERKKLAKEEEMFRRQEEEKSGNKGKKKRSSGGSNVNTPSATSSSKRLGFDGPSARYADASTPKQVGLPSGKPAKRPKGPNAPKTPTKPITRVVKRPKPDYVDSEVQCDLDKEEESKRIALLPARKPFLSTSQRLLQRCAVNNVRRNGAGAVAEAERSVKEEGKMDVDQPAQPSPKPASLDLSNDRMEPEPTPRPHTPEDTSMNDTEAEEQSSPPPQVESNETQDATEQATAPISPDVTTHLPTNPPAPPWLSQLSDSAQETPTSPQEHHHKPPGMHLQMPPPPANPFAGPPSAAASGLSTATPTSLTGSAMAHSPLSLTGSGSGSGPLFSPAVTAAVAPSPAKKKMSLSDYTKRKVKDKAGNEAKGGERESSPASGSGSGSGAVVPPLQGAAHASSSPPDGGRGATTAGEKESSEAVVEDDDVRMEDARESSTKD